MTRCGLLIERPDGSEPIPVPLTGVSVQVRIVDLVAEVEIEQRYVNRENQPIEAVYKFPLDEGAGVCSFTAELEGRVIEGVVKETEQAQAEYREAIESGHSAFLVEEKLPDVFKAKIGNLPAGSGAKIRLTYITELKVERGEVRFFLPTTIAPRYVPTTDTSSAATDLASIKYTQESHYELEFQASVKMGSAVKGIRSPTHTIAVTNDADLMKRSVRLGEMVMLMDRDLVLYIQVEEPHQLRLISQKSVKNGSVALMLSLVPSFKLDEQKTELIFVVDRSGSMQGEGIQQAKQALTLFLHSLPVDCYVNIVGFGSTFHLFFPASRKYSDEVLQLTKDHAETLDANLGGTEIYAPLEAILQQRPIEGYLRQIFILTDGEVSNVDQVISLVRRQSGNARVFSLGLGSSASHHLVEGIARAGNGTALFASLEERLEKKVMQQLQDALQPALTDIKVHWEGYDETTEAKAPVQTELTLMGFGKPLATETNPNAEKPEQKLRQAPCDTMIPPVFDGKHLVVYALLKKDAHLPEWAKLVAVSPAGPLTVQVPLNSSACEEGELLHRLAAKKLIQLLQDKQDDEDAKKEIIQLGCEYGLASRYTSYIAVDPTDQKNLKESWMMMKSRDIPVQMAYGWGGGGWRRANCFQSAAGPMVGMAMPCSAPQPMMMRSAMAYKKSGAPQMMSFAPEMATFGAAPASAFGNVVADSVAPPTFAVAASARSVKMSPARQLQRFLSRTFKISPSPSDVKDVTTYSDSGVRKKSREMDSEDDEMDSMDTDGFVEEKAPVTDDDKLMKLVSIQSFDGAFKLNPILAQLLDTTLEDIKDAGEKGKFAEAVWFTLVALAFLMVGLPQLQSSWILVANKAERWLRSQQLADVAAAKTEAEQFVKAKLRL